MIKRKLISALVMTFCVCVVGATAGLAQGKYANVYSRGDVDGFISNLENSSDVFSRDFKNAGGTSNSERRIVDRFENAVDRLRNRFNSNNNWWQSRNDVQGMMGEARQVNVMMNNERFARRLEQQWRNLRRDINKLADTYDLPDLGGGRWDGGGGWNGGGGGIGNPGGPTSRPPNWAIGTWSWIQGYDRQFSIDANGTVTEMTGGRVNYGTYNRGSIYLNGNQSTVTRTANGIRTYNMSTGETSDYVRSSGVGTGPGWGGGGGPTSRPPDWAVGMWQWVQGYDRRFSIDSNGRVTEYTGGQTNYGTYYNGVINLNGNTSTVTRTRNGIRTYNQQTGETSDYIRQR